MKENKIGFLNSIKSRLIALMTVFCVLPLTIAIIISYTSSKSVAQESAESLNLTQAELVGQDFSKTLDANFSSMKQAAAAKSTREFVKAPTDESKFEVMVAQLQAIDSDFGDGNSTVITGMDGENIARSKGNFTNIAERGYFKEASSGHEYVSELSVSKTTGARIIVPAIPVYDDDAKTVIAVLTRNYDIDYLHETIAAETSKGQEIFIMDAEGNVIVTSDRELTAEDEVIVADREVFTKAASAESASFIEKYNGKKYFTSFVKEPHTGWAVVVSTDYDVIMAKSQNAAVSMVIIGVVMAIIAVVIAVLFANSINNPIKMIHESLGLLAQGQFKQIEFYSRRKDEFGAMIKNTNSVIDVLNDIVSTIRGIADDLETDASEVSDTATQISDTMDDISQAVQEIASGATQQADEIQQATESIGIISGNIEGVTGDADSLAGTADTMKKDSSSSQNELRELEKSSQQMADAIERITVAINATSVAVDNISSKVEAIDSIASQTSLLALNASIEAARAGDAGRGFAVVAEEIGKLATDSASSANEIKEEMNNLLSQAQEAVKVADDVAKSNKAQYETIGRTVGSIQNLIDGIGTTVEGVGSINSNASACNDSKIVVVDAMNNLSAISQENAASTEETSASMQELNATVNTLAHEATQLKEHADILADKMKFFK